MKNRDIPDIIKEVFGTLQKPPQPPIRCPACQQIGGHIADCILNYKKKSV